MSVVPLPALTTDVTSTCTTIPLTTPTTSSVVRCSYSIQETVDEIMNYLKVAGSESYLGDQEESVTQLSHSLQAAEQACLYDAENEEMIIAALLHDIGHMILQRPDVWDTTAVNNTHNIQSEQHEWVGYHYLLEHGFSPYIADLVLGHVQAKRYLTYADKAYYDRLSESSKMTLIGQGGPFTETYAAFFRNQDSFKIKILMREWDEAAKIIEWTQKGNEFQIYTDMIIRHLKKQQIPPVKQEEQQPRAA